MVIARPHRCRFSRITAVLALALLVAGASGACAMPRKFKVDRIHQQAAAQHVKTPIIFIHGFIGAKLKNRNTHETIWGRFMNAIKMGKSADLVLPIDSTVMSENRDDLVPYALYESVAGVKFYGAILDTLREAGGYKVGDIDHPKPGDNCFVFVYDWRRDNVESAITLGRKIRQLKHRLGDPGLRFDIVAHSMGGLVAEYYLKYGARDALEDPPEKPLSYAGARDINRLVLVGTPRRGTMGAFEALNIGISRTLSVEAIFTMPSVYQLLPSDGRTHLIDPEGNPLDVDFHDAESWVLNGWSVFDLRNRSVRRQSDLEHVRNTGGSGPSRLEQEKAFLQSALDRSRAFHDAIHRESVEGSPVPIHIFGSDCIPTLDQAIVKQTPSGPVTIFDDETSPDRSARRLERLMMVPGDGTVTAESLLSRTSTDDLIDDRRGTRSYSSTFFFCETHGLLPAHRGFQDNLFHVLFHNSARPPAGAHVVGGR